MGKEQEFYVVTAYRFGNRSAHSYVVGIFNKKHAAINAAEKHAIYRGGKYECDVDMCFLNQYDNDADSYSEVIYTTRINKPTDVVVIV